MPIFDMIDVFVLSEKGIESIRKNASIHKTWNPSFKAVNKTCIPLFDNSKEFLFIFHSNILILKWRYTMQK